MSVYPSVLYHLSKKYLLGMSLISVTETRGLHRDASAN